MRLSRFDPRLRHVDEAGCITHFAGVKINSGKGIEWISVDDLPGDPPYAELLKATDREYMEHFRNDWANTWRIANIPTEPSNAALFINPSTGGPVGKFLLSLIEYPRYSDSFYAVYVGGVRFTGPLTPNDSLKLTADESVDCAGDGGAFDHCTRQFGLCIKELGKRFNCATLAMNAIGRLGELVTCLASLSEPNPDSFDGILIKHDALADALHALSLAIARCADAKPTSPTPADTASKPHKSHRLRTKGCTNREIAALFNSKAAPLVARIDKEKNKPVYELKRGGGGGVLYVGKCSARTIRDWIKNYPDVNHSEPRCGFHAGMLTDPEALKRAVELWGKYCYNYAKAFFQWRQIHKSAPRSQFRYKPQTIIHNNNL